MRAVLLTGFGSYEKLEYRQDVPVPTPAAEEVLIRVGACAVNNTDIWTREGAYGANRESAWQGGGIEFPRIQGADMVGRIEEVGDAVSPRRVGERVIVNPSIYGGGGEGLFGATYIASERDGGFAEFACVPSRNALTIDSPLSDAELATFITSYLTAEHMLARAQLNAGETVLITGASGGVGSALVQLAKIRGARTIAVVGRGKEQRLRSFGVDCVVLRDERNYADAIKAVLGSVSVDVVADVVAGDRVQEVLDLLRVGGRYVTAGAIAGPMVTLDWRRLYLRHLSILGATMGTQRDFERVIGHVASGRLKPLLAATYGLDRLVEAQKAFKERRHFGKLVIVP